MKKNKNERAFTSIGCAMNGWVKLRWLQSNLTIPGICNVWQTTDDSLTISWPTDKTKNTGLCGCSKQKSINTYFIGTFFFLHGQNRLVGPKRLHHQPTEQDRGAARRQHQEVSCSFLIFGSFGPWMNWTWSEIVCQRRHPRDWRANSRT